MKFLKEFLNSGTVKQQNRKRMGALLIGITAVLLAIALVVLMVASIVTALKNKEPVEEPEDSGAVKIPNGYTTTTFTEGQAKTGDLVLIDAEHPYDGEAPSVVLLNTTDNRPKDEATGEYLYWMADTTKFSLTEEAAAAFVQLVTDFYAAEKDNNLYVLQAYTTGVASDLYKNGCTLKLNYYTEAPATASIYDVENDQPIEKYQWIYDNAATYGFVQASEAEGDENVFRYVGVAHATYMKNNSKTLAEYLAIVQTKTCRSQLTISVRNAEGKTVNYGVYYLKAGEELIVPTKNPYTVSGDNMGGYVITVDKSTTIK